MDPYVGVTGTNYETTDELKKRFSNLQNVEYPELWIIKNCYLFINFKFVLKTLIEIFGAKIFKI